MHDLQHSTARWAVQGGAWLVWMRCYLVINLKRKRLVFGESPGGSSSASFGGLRMCHSSVFSKLLLIRCRSRSYRPFNSMGLQSTGARGLDRIKRRDAFLQNAPEGGCWIWDRTPPFRAPESGLSSSSSSPPMLYGERTVQENTTMVLS